MGDNIQGLVTYQSIGPALAGRMVVAALSAAAEHGSIEKSFCVVLGSKDQTKPLATGGFGTYSPANFDIAHAKARTVMATGLSTHELAKNG